MDKFQSDAKPVVMYTTRFCPFCTAAKRLFEEKEISFETVDLTGEANFREELYNLTGGRTVPQILIHGTPVGGYKELTRLAETGILEKLLPETAPLSGK
ncbi:MAG TPA: glutaredoxin domain-containing protein [bacterium]|nr:glutaredoxin domain-containing protein [bacterium]